MTYKELGIIQDMPRGWKSKEIWRCKASNMWYKMWDRCYNPNNKNYERYKDCNVYNDFKFLSKYIEWIMQEPRFEEFCNTCDSVMWCVDKDLKMKGNRDYIPKYMTLIPQSENARETFLRSPRNKSVIGICNKVILLYYRVNDVAPRFNPSSVSKCCRKLQENHHNFEWWYLNYRHCKILRVKEGEYIGKNSK